MKKSILVVASTVFASSLAFAGAHMNSKSGEAKAMVEAITSGENASIPAKEIKGGWGIAAGLASENGSAAVGDKPNPKSDSED